MLRTILTCLLLFPCLKLNAFASSKSDEQAVLPSGPQIDGMFSDALELSPNKICKACHIQPEAACGNCSVPALLCCRCDYPCCCNKQICGTISCMTVLRKPDEQPSAAFLTFLGLGDDAPCCGPECSMDRCLELIKLQLGALQVPLEIERNNTGDGDGYSATQDDDTPCCGIGCSARGCFQKLLDSIILLQTPIQNTLDNFNKSRPDAIEGGVHGGL